LLVDGLVGCNLGHGLTARRSDLGQDEARRLQSEVGL
jgi:hypothetical protein